MTWFVNYRLSSSLSVTDRGLAYGDGVFETIPTSFNFFSQLDDHLLRLALGLEKLGMPFSSEQFSHLKSFLLSDVLPLIEVSSVVKIIVTRGKGGRGYLPPSEPDHTVIIGISSAPDYDEAQKQGVSLAISPVTVNKNPLLSGIKHLNRLENILAKQYLAELDFEAIMLDSEGFVVECIQSNIFWYKENVLYTPCLKQAGVEGTYRKSIIQSHENLSPVVFGDFCLHDVLSADEVFICNSLMKIVPVIKLEEKMLSIGLNTKKLQLLMQGKDLHALS